MAINLTGITITFHIFNAGVTYNFTNLTGLTTTPLTGTIDVKLSPAQTEPFISDEAGGEETVSYFKFLYLDSRLISKVQQNERVLAAKET